MSFINISILIPFLNESQNITHLVTELDKFCKANKEKTFEVIFVNDGSTDNSLALLKDARPSFRSSVISFSKNFGAHAALRAGIQKAQGDFITFMYADLQDPLELINTLYGKCRNVKSDICWASINNFTRSIFQRAFSKMYARLIKRYVSKDFPENGFDIVMFNKKVQAVLNANVESNSSIFLQILTLGFKSESITYTKVERKAGKSKWTFSKRMKLMIDSFVSFSYAPIRFVTIVGIILFFLGFLLSAYLIVRKVIWNDLAAGWPMLISILMLGFGITNISLGIIAEYLWRTLDVARKRPVFIIDEIHELNEHAK
jgi:dolichol-phosphate mannosyltransferase